MINFFRKLQAVLDKNGIKLDSNGCVDYSQCQNEQIIRKMKSKEDMVLEALLLSHFNYGIDHQLDNDRKLHNIQKELMSIEKENFKELEELIHKTTQNNYAKEIDIKKSDIDLILDTFIHSKEKKNPITDLNKIHTESLDVKSFVIGKYSKIDWDKELLQNRYERIEKLKILFFGQNFIKDWGKTSYEYLNDNLVNDFQNESDKINNNSGISSNEIKFLENLQDLANNLKTSIAKMRRLKFIMNQKHLHKFNKKIFNDEPHLDYDTEYVDINMLTDYLNLPEHLRIHNSDDLEEDYKVKAILTRYY